MITSQFVLGGSQGTYPVYDFTGELNYERVSTLTVRMDPNFAEALAGETFLKFYCLDNELFSGIPVYAKVDNDVLELTIYDKIASLWLVGGFAISEGSGVISYKNRSANEIVADVIRGSQFYVTSTSVPDAVVSQDGDWATKTDFLFSIAKQIIDSTGNLSTVWVDDKNVVYIGPKNGDKTIDLSTKIVDTSAQELNFVKYGGVVVKGGTDENGIGILETSMKEFTYTDYNLTDKSIDTFDVSYDPQLSQQKVTVDIDEINNKQSLQFAYSKDISNNYNRVYNPDLDGVLNNKYYGAGVLLKDPNIFYQFNELDCVFQIWFDKTSNTAIDTWSPTIGPDHVDQGLPYTYLKNISVGFMDANGNVIVEASIEKFSDNIYTQYSMYGNVVRTISDTGVVKFCMNATKMDKSLGLINQSSTSYWPIRNSKFLVRLRFANKTWSMKVIAADENYTIPLGTGQSWGILRPIFRSVRKYRDNSSGTWLDYIVLGEEHDFCYTIVPEGITIGSYGPGSQIPINTHNFKVGDSVTVTGLGADYDGTHTISNVSRNSIAFATSSTSPQNVATTTGYVQLTETVTEVFNATCTYPDGTPAEDMFVGGYPFIRSQCKTSVSTSLYQDRIYISQVSNIPFIVGMPLKTVQHKPYLFYNDASIRHKSQARALADNIYSDYQKVISADIEVDPMSFFYPTDPTKRFTIGWNVTLAAPSDIVGNYRIRAITFTQDRVTISLKNRNLALPDVIDRIQKQLKEVS